MKNLVLAGGRASRELSVLVPEGRNKVLLRVLGKPVIYYSLRGLQRTNRAETVLVYRSGEEEVYREAARHSEAAITPVVQERGNSVHEAILCAESKLRDTSYFFLAFGDLVLDEEAFSQVASHHLSEEPDATVLAVPVEPRHVETYGLVVVDEYGHARKVVDGPISAKIEEPLYAIGGVYVLPTWILDLLERGYTLPQAIGEVASRGRVRVVHWSGLWIDVGYPADLLEASYQLLSRMRGQAVEGGAEVEPSAVVEGPVRVERGAYVDHCAVIKGPAYIGEGSFVGAHSFIRSFVDLESEVWLGAYNEVRHSSLQPRVVTHSRVTIMDSVVGEGAVFEANITLLNVLPEHEHPPRLRTHIHERPGERLRKMGSVIGYRCRISTNRVLSPGTILEPNTVL